MTAVPEPEKVDPKARLIVVLLAVSAVGAAFTAAWARTKMMHMPMPHIATLPAMSLTAHDGTAIDRSTFDGKVTVVDFIFTRLRQRRDSHVQTRTCCCQHIRIAFVFGRTTDSNGCGGDYACWVCHVISFSLLLRA